MPNYDSEMLTRRSTELYGILSEGKEIGPMKQGQMGLEDPLRREALAASFLVEGGLVKVEYSLTCDHTAQTLKVRSVRRFPCQDVRWY